MTFALVCGVLLGVLVAMVVVPERQETTRVLGGSDASELSAGAGSPSVDGGVVASDGGGTAGGSVSTIAGGPASTTGGTVAGAAPAGAATRSAGAVATGPVGRGVSAEKIRIGIAQGDISAVRVLGPRYEAGDMKQHVEAVVAAWKREGKLPVNGRDIEFVFRKYQVLVPEEQRAACVNLVQQDKVFAVIAPYPFGVGSECVASEQQTPLLSVDEQLDEVYKRAPMLFSVYPSFGRSLRNAAHWADQEGLLEGHKIGIYYTQKAKALFDATFTAELKKLGYSYTVEQTRAQANGGPEDGLAVQRMKAAGVDVVFLAADPSEATPTPTARAGTFLQQAQSQDYHPQYAIFPIMLGTGDTTNSGVSPQEEWDGARSMVYLRHGERGTGLKFEPPTEKCVSDFERHSGKKIPRSGPAPNAEETSVLAVCDTLNIVLDALRRAGPTVNNQTIVAGLEGIRGLPMATAASVSYGPGKHFGIDFFRSWRWDSKCLCGKIVGSPAWRPFPVA